MLKQIGMLYFVFSIPLMSLAWGPKGHQMIGIITQQNLTPQAQLALKKLYGHPPDLGHEAIWPDEIRPNKAYDRFKPWHYVDFPRITDISTILSAASVRPLARRSTHPVSWSAEENASIGFIDALRQFSDYLLIPHAEAGDAIQAVNQMAWLMASPRSTTELRKFAFRYLIHILGDIHQPLHAGNGKDLGGNACLVTWKGRSEHTYPDGATVPMNLHTVWDEELLTVRQCHGHSCLQDEYVQYLKREYPATFRKFKNEDVAGVFMVAEWANESAQIRDGIYPASACGHLEESSAHAVDGPQLDEKYFQLHERTLESQLIKAGLRTAKILNQLLPYVK
jgi:hypothetical protein